MRKKHKLIFALTGILLITASTAAFLKIINRRDSLTDTLQREKTQKPSEISSSIEDQKPVPTLSSINVKQSSKWGNTPSNISNGGYFALQDGYLYFETGNINELANSIKKSHKISRTRDDGITGLTLLDSKPYARNINVVGEWLYYTSTNDIWKEKINGEGLESIKRGNITQFIIYDNIMYYIKDNTLEKCSVDSPEYTSIIDDNIIYFMLSEDGKNIFYINATNYSDSAGFAEDTKFILYKTDMEGKSKQEILQVPISSNIVSIMIYKNSIFIMKYDELVENKNPVVSIYKINADNSEHELEKFIDGSQYIDLSSMNISGKYLYYTARTVSSNNLEIHRIDLDTKIEDIVKSSNIISVTSPLHAFEEKAYFIGYRFGQGEDTRSSVFWVDFDSNTIRANKGY